MGNVGIGFIGKPCGHQFVRVGLEDAGQFEYLFALGTAFAVLIAAIGRHIYTDEEAVNACRYGLTVENPS